MPTTPVRQPSLKICPICTQTFTIQTSSTDFEIHVNSCVDSAEYTAKTADFVDNGKKVKVGGGGGGVNKKKEKQVLFKFKMRRPVLKCKRRKKMKRWLLFKMLMYHKMPINLMN